MKKILIIAFILLGQHSAVAQIIKDVAAEDVVHSELFQLSKYKNQRGVVAIFYSGKCPYGEYYLKRILALQEKHKDDRIAFVLINSNSSEYVPEESASAMKEYALRKGIDFPYLNDKEKKIKAMLRATRTPEVFLLKPQEDGFKVVYRGAFDDSPQSAGDVNHAYLAGAIVNLLSGKKPDVNQTRPVGCLIK